MNCILDDLIGLHLNEKSMNLWNIFEVKNSSRHLWKIPYFAEFFCLSLENSMFSSTNLMSLEMFALFTIVVAITFIINNDLYFKAQNEFTPTQRQKFNIIQSAHNQKVFNFNLQIKLFSIVNRF